MPFVRLLEVELYPTLLSKARSYGLSDSWVQVIILLKLQILCAYAIVFLPNIFCATLPCTTKSVFFFYQINVDDQSALLY